MPKTSCPGPECGQTPFASCTEAVAAALGFVRNPPGRMADGDTNPCCANDGRRPIRDLRDFDGRVEEHERPVAVGSEDGCLQIGHEIQRGTK